MKKYLLAPLLLLSLVLTSCIDIVEEINLTASGAGNYTTKVNMSGMFEMMEGIAAMDTSQRSNELSKLTEQKLDSSFSFKSFTDTSTKLTAAQKKFFSEGTVRMQMNGKEKQFFVTVNFPFQNVQDIKMIGKGTGGTGGLDLLGKAAGGSGLGAGAEQNLPTMDVFDLNFGAGLLERKVNKAKLEEARSSGQFKEAEKAVEMLSQMKMTTIIHLPKPAKKASGDALQLSADKMTVTISTNFADLVNNPAVLAYRVEY